MEENPLLAAFAKLVADFLHAPENNPEILHAVLQHCARALLQGQEAAHMRDTFAFERIQHFTTQYLQAEDYQMLAELFDKVAMELQPGQPALHLFFREMPDRASWLRSSIPNWAFGAALTETVGSLVNRDGRRFWIDLYQTAPDGKKEVRIAGGNRPLLYLAPDGALSVRVVGMAFNFPMTEVAMGEGSIWIQARLFTQEAPDDLYCGLRVTEVSLVSPRMFLPDLYILQHPFNANIKSTLTIKLAPAAPIEEPDTTLGTDARQAGLVLPEALRITLTPTSFSLQEIFGNPEWTVYGDQKQFSWTKQPATFNSSFSAVSIPMDLQNSEFVSAYVQSPIFGLSGSAVVNSAAWLLPAAKLNIPLQAEGAGMLSTELEAGLHATFAGWLDANQIDPAQLRFDKTLLIAAPGLLQIMSIETASEYVRQVYQLWLDPAGKWNDLEMHFHGKFPFVYQSSATGMETYVALGNCTGRLDRPVAADGKTFALQTKNSMCVRAHGSEHDQLLIYDENILQDNLALAPAGIPSPFQSQALALNNALLTVSPLNAFLLSGRLPSYYNAVESASLCYAFGLFSYLPALPDPYAANTGIFQDMHTQQQGRNGAYTIDQINRLLVGTMRWEAYQAPAVRFIFGDMDRSVGNLPLRLDLLQNLGIASEKTYRQYETRAQKAAARVSRRTGAELRSWDQEYNVNIHVNDSYQNQHFFSLLDLSTAADWMGVNVGVLDEGLLFERSFEVLPGQNPLSADGMDIVATGRFVRLFTVPQISWEPVTNLSKPSNAANDPPGGLLLFKDDGPPTLIGNTGATAVPIAPLPLAHYIEQHYRENPAFKAWSFFSLPFGMLGMARYTQEGMNIGEPPGSMIRLVQEQFPDDMQTSLQISTRGYLHPQGNRNFEGTTEQLFNLYNQYGGPLDRSILSKSVSDIFNGEFGTDGNYGRLRVRGVPVERYDFSGYGANLFSHWLNPQAKIGQTSQAKFDVWRGRTAHEVIQVRSILYPWAIRVVRTITIFRESTGLVYRVDSGWRAESDGIYDFRTELITGKNAAGNDITVLETNGYSFHPGLVKGVFGVCNIVETEDANIFTKNWNKTNGYFIDPNDGMPKSVGAGQLLQVSMIPVYFDADVQLEKVIQGGQNDRVPSKRMLGFLQITPQGIPIAAEDFARLLQENKGLGGPVDCLIDIAGSKQQMRINRVEVQPSFEAGKIVFVVAAKGTPVLPKDGSWSVVQHKKSTLEVLPVGDTGIPLVRRGLHGILTMTPWELADPLELFQADPEDRGTQFAFLQNTDTQKVLFRNPFFETDQPVLKCSKPDLADAYRLLESKGIFPKLQGLPRIDLNDFDLEIVDQGYQLFNKLDPGKALEQVLPEGPIYFVNGKDVKIYVEYAKKDIKGNKIGDGTLNFDLKSNDNTWANKLNDITMVVDLLDMKRLFLIRGKLDTAKGQSPAFTGPELEFGEDLQPVYNILQILLLLNGGDYAGALTKGLKIAMSNSPNNWEYKFQADKEIPVLRFPPPFADSPVAPLRLECYLKLGCYFNVGLPQAGGGLPVPSGGGYVEFGARLSVMCVSLAAATVYAVGTCVLRIGADTISGPNLYLKAGFGVELMVGLPVIGSVSVYYGAGVEIYIDQRTIIAGGFIVFRGRAELIGGLVTIQIQIEAAGKIARTGDRTDLIAQVTFSLDISIFLVINISFSKSFEERRQIA